MKKLFLIGFVSTTCLLVAFSAVLAASANKVSQVQQEFLDRVEAGQTEELLRTLHPALRDEIDAPLMDRMVTVINERLGKVEGVTPTGIHVTKDTAGTHVKYDSKIQFENGESTATFVTLDGRLIEFNLLSPKLHDWFEMPTEAPLYQETGKEFLRLWLTGETDAAWDAMHPQLQKVVDRKRLAEMSARVIDKFGAIHEIEFKGTRVGDGSQTPTLFIDYSVKTERETLSGEIEFQFEGLQGHLLGFKI